MSWEESGHGISREEKQIDDSELRKCLRSLLIGTDTPQAFPDHMETDPNLSASDSPWG